MVFEKRMNGRKPNTRRKEPGTADTYGAAVRVRLQPKIAFIPEIYLRFGREFGRAFLNEELNIDLKSVIKEHTYAELVKNDENTDKIVDDLVARFQDAAAFHKIILTEVSVLFRNPDDEDDDD